MTQEYKCGCIAVLPMDRNLAYMLHWYGVLGTNTKAELMALWGLLWFTIGKHVHHIHIYGDSKTIIEGIYGTMHFDPPLLQNWKARTLAVIHFFKDL